MGDTIQETIQRTQRYWYIDGLTEMAAGTVILLMGICYLLLGLVNPESTAAWIVGIGQPVIVVLGWFVSNKAVKALKERLTYPRTGFVSYRNVQGNNRLQRLVQAGTISFIMAVLVGFVLRRVAEDILPIIIGTLIAFAIFLMGNRFGLIRFYVLAIYALLLGLLGAWLALPDTYSSAFFFSGLGIGWLASGSVTLIHYLSSTQPLEAE